MKQTENTFYAFLHNVYLLPRSYTFARQVTFTLEFGRNFYIFVQMPSKMRVSVSPIYPPSEQRTTAQDINHIEIFQGE